MTKSQRYYQSIRADRNEWCDSMPPKCMRCGRPWHKFRWPEIHEILTRAQAPGAWGFRANYLALCNPCHALVQNMPHAEQLAIKKRADPKNYDLDDWLRRRNPKAMRYVTEEEVEACL